MLALLARCKTGTLLSTVCSHIKKGTKNTQAVAETNSNDVLTEKKKKCVDTEDASFMSRQVCLWDGLNPVPVGVVLGDTFPSCKWSSGPIQTVSPAARAGRHKNGKKCV